MNISRHVKYKMIKWVSLLMLFVFPLPHIASQPSDGIALDMALSPGGGLVAIASSDATVKIIDLATPLNERLLQGHTAEVFAVDWSTDGSLLASADANGNLIIWNTNNWQPIRNISYDEPNTAFFDVDWKPDSSLVAVADSRRSISIYNPTTGILYRRLVGHREAVSSVAWSIDGNYILSGGWDSQLILWDVSTSQPIKRMTLETSNVINCIKWHPDGLIAAVGTSDGYIRIWELFTGNLVTGFQAHDDHVFGTLTVDWNIEGTYLASGGGDNNIHVWNTVDFQLKDTLVTNSRVYSTVFALDSESILYYENGLSNFTPQTGLTYIDIIIPPTDGMILITQDDTRFQAVAYDPAVGTNDGDGIQGVEFEVYNLSGTLIHSSSDATLTYCAFGGAGPCDVAPAGLLGLPGTYTLKARAQATDDTWTDWVARTFVVSADTDTGKLGTGRDKMMRQLIRLCSLACIVLISQMTFAQSATSYRYSWSRDGSRLIMTAHHDPAFTVTVYDDQWQPLASRQAPCCGVSLSPDGDSLLVDSVPAEIWDTDTLQTVRVLPDLSGAAVWSPDGSELATFNYNPPGGMRIHSATDGHLLREFTRSTAIGWASPNGPVWSPNGAYFVAAFSNQLILLDATTGLQVGDNYQLDGDIYAYSWSPDSTRVALGLIKRLPTEIEGSFPAGGSPGNYDLNSIVVFEIATGSVTTLRSGFRRPATVLGWSPDGRYIATVLDGNVYTMDSANGNLIDRLSVLPNFALIGWSPNGGRLLTGLYTNVPYDPAQRITPSSPIAPRSTFAKTELDGMIQVLAPAAAPERLQSILAACSDDPQLQSSAAALIAAGQYQEFITLVDASTTLPAACAADLRLMAEALASGQTAPPSSPVIQITVPPTDGTTLTTQDDTRFQAVAYDSAVGTNDGGGIQRVEFEVYNPSGTLIYSLAETQAAFCTFGGNVPCNIAPSGLLGLPGTYTLKARAQSTGGTWTDWVARTFVVSADTGTGLLGETLADLLSDPNCASACYLGIEPGVTTQMELETILNQRDISFTSERIGSGPLISYLFEPAAPSIYFATDPYLISVDVAGEIVDLIIIITDNITVMQMISWFGAPDAIRDDVRFYYFSKGLIFSSGRGDPNQIRLVFVTRPGRDALRISRELDLFQTCDGPTEICAIPTATATPTVSPIVTVTVTVPPTDGTTLTTQDDTRFQAVVYDPAVGTNDGDGIQGVEFEVYNPSGTLIYPSSGLSVASRVLPGGGAGGQRRTGGGLHQPAQTGGESDLIFFMKLFQSP